MSVLLCCGCLVLLALTEWKTTTTQPSSAGGFPTTITTSTAEVVIDYEDKEEEDPAVQQVRRLVQDADTETIARFKAAEPGYRWHPSYYSDKYLLRSNLVPGSGAATAMTHEFGAWTLVDTKRASRPDDAFYNQYPHRDVPWSDFPDDTAWQKDAEYLPEFLDEGIALAERAMEAILTEYGYGKDRDETPFEERMMRLSNNLVGNSYQGLVRRVLHAIVTEDTFVFAMAGHSSAAGESMMCASVVLNGVGSSFSPFHLSDTNNISIAQDTETTSSRVTPWPLGRLWNPSLLDWEFMRRLVTLEPEEWAPCRMELLLPPSWDPISTCWHGTRE